MITTTPVTDLIKQRYSVRSYQPVPVSQAVQADLRLQLDSIQKSPFGTPLRLILLAATEADTQSLRGLGTYGTIKNPTGYMVGAVKNEEHAMEDFGYGMQQAILAATALEIGTCWLGGLFTQSSFAKKTKKQKDELIPAVVSIGYAEEGNRSRDKSRQMARSDTRLPWESIFFAGQFGQPLNREAAGPYAEALDMLRLAPSASNKQPWRIVKDGRRWHFYCQRTPGYGKDTLLFKLAGLADLQRLDIGIAMCHFELTARQNKLDGQWISQNPNLPVIEKNTIYIASWEEKQA